MSEPRRFKLVEDPEGDHGSTRLPPGPCGGRRGGATVAERRKRSEPVKSKARRLICSKLGHAWPRGYSIEPWRMRCARCGESPRG